jgi:hypothetical protein
MTDDERRFLTEPEAAKVLRKSTSTIKRLRLGGHLSYLPGRPVLIAAADLETYIERLKVPANVKTVDSAPSSDPTAAERSLSARKWALTKKLLRRRK